MYMHNSQESVCIYQLNPEDVCVATYYVTCSIVVYNISHNYRHNYIARMVLCSKTLQHQSHISEDGEKTCHRKTQA